MDRRLVLAALLVGACAAARADERGFGLDALRGLAAFQVVVDPLSADAMRDGLRAPALQADVELRLRRAGLRVVTERGTPVPDAAVLRVHLDDTRRDLDAGSFHEFRLTMEVLQNVQLTRDPAVQALRPSWNRTLDGTHLTATLVPAVRDALRQEMEHLFDDYLAVNGGAVARAAAATAVRRHRPEGD